MSLQSETLRSLHPSQASPVEVTPLMPPSNEILCHNSLQSVPPVSIDETSAATTQLSAPTRTSPFLPSGTNTPAPSITSTLPPPPYIAEAESISGISSAQFRYIQALNESSEPYEQYFDSLQIKQNKHDAFFRDLRLFRSDAHIIRLLAAPPTSLSVQEHVPLPTTSLQSQADKSPASVHLQQVYRETTTQFLASPHSRSWFNTLSSSSPSPNPQSAVGRRFSILSPARSPTSPSTVTSPTPNSNSKASRRTSWLFPNQPPVETASAPTRQDEERLHSFLSPIWLIFRTKMTPSPDLLSRFLAWETRKIAEEESRALRQQADQVQATKQGRKARPVSYYARGNYERKVPEGRGLDAMFDYDSDDDKGDDGVGLGISSRNKRDGDDEEEDQTAAATAVAKMFVGAATAGYMLENKRVRNYLMKKLG